MSVELRKLQKSDAKLFAELANDMRIAENTSDRFPHPYSESDAQRFIDLHQGESNAAVFGILFNGDLVGGIGLHFRADIYRKTAELGYWVNPKFWGKGIATKAITKILDFGFWIFEFRYCGSYGSRFWAKCGFPTYIDKTKFYAFGSDS